ncbi:MAG TPA: FG-GAP-like repeat-containing protein, partial [Longimicrobium sp.]
VEPTAWSVVCAADFTGDGQADWLWHNRASGGQTIWRMDGSRWTGQQTALLPAVGPEWTVSACADYTGDGKPDIVWQNPANGQGAVWQMSGTSWSGAQTALPTVPPEWRIATGADFTGDGQADLVLQNVQTGRRVIWQMAGTALAASLDLTVQPVAWSIVASGDFTGDGQPDLLWQNRASGESTIWHMSRTQWPGQQTAQQRVPPEWHMVAAMGTPAATAGPPVPSFTTMVTGSTARADGSGTTDGGASPVQFAYHWGDGAVDAGWRTDPVAEHVYAQPGTYTITLYVKNAAGYGADPGPYINTTRQVTIQAPASTEARIALYRCFAAGKHMVLVGADCLGATQESRYGFAAATQAPGTVPLYGSRNPVSGHFLATLSAAEHQGMVTTSGWHDYGLLGYVWQSAGEGRVAIHRLLSTGQDDHLYSVFATEGQPGYQLEAQNYFYLATNPSGVSIAAPQLSSVSPNPVPASTSDVTVVLSGANFQSGATVTAWWGANPGDSTRLQASSQVFVESLTKMIIKVTTGAGCATWRVRVNNPDGKNSAEYSFPVSCAPTPRPVVNDYPYPNANPANADPWLFYYRECTSFAASRINRDKFGSSTATSFHNYYGSTTQYGQVHWSHAANWGNAAASIGARNLGVRIHSEPAVGRIAQWDAGYHGGHRDFG